ncbi:MAG: late competence development ComFB family protein [Spirochaetaceae bacterium]|jgi:competence protein ComFB|nr:late competence development ComFB family protein [Spirochaetaceae bacterium]
MAFADKYDFELLKNESEKLVLEELGRQLDDPKAEDVCRCNTCIVDMAAMALNMVKPLYRVSLLGTQYAAQAMSDKAYATGVKKGVANAIEKVRKNPAHD